MEFGNHIPEHERDRTTQAPMAAFTRGIKPPGRQWTFEFGNGYGASVINDGYGSEEGLYEVGVLHGGKLTYQTPLTDDVLGFQTHEQVVAVLDAIAALTPADIRREQIRRLVAERDALKERIAEINAQVSA